MAWFSLWFLMPKTTPLWWLLSTCISINDQFWGRKILLSTWATDDVIIPLCWAKHGSHLNYGISHACLQENVQWFAAHLEHRCKKEKQNHSIKNRPLHHKYTISLGVVCFRVYLSTIFEFFCLTECSKWAEIHCNIITASISCVHFTPKELWNYIVWHAFQAS